jgi:hypothetical protein
MSGHTCRPHFPAPRLPTTRESSGAMSMLPVTCDSAAAVCPTVASLTESTVGTKFRVCATCSLPHRAAGGAGAMCDSCDGFNASSLTVSYNSATAYGGGLALISCTGPQYLSQVSGWLPQVMMRSDPSC